MIKKSSQIHKSIHTSSHAPYKEKKQEEERNLKAYRETTVPLPSSSSSKRFLLLKY
jgi:hypothetical protein